MFLYECYGLPSVLEPFSVQCLSLFLFLSILLLGVVREVVVNVFATHFMRLTFLDYFIFRIQCI